MTFDTTASNTGYVSAACVALQQSIGHALLWSACSHQVGEVILKQVFNDLHIEVSKSPEVIVLSKFKKPVYVIPHVIDETLSPFNPEAYSNDSQMITHIKVWMETTTVAAESFVDHQRDDYTEFSELCLLE